MTRAVVVIGERSGWMDDVVAHLGDIAIVDYHGDDYRMGTIALLGSEVRALVVTSPPGAVKGLGGLIDMAKLRGKAVISAPPGDDVDIESLLGRVAALPGALPPAARANDDRPGAKGMLWEEP